MNRPDIYIKQAHAMAAWLRAQGDPEGADLADSLAENLNVNHEAVDDQTTPEWLALRDPDALDTEPAIRCWPEVGCVFEGEDGPVLTIDPMDGGDVSIVHMGDIVKWMSGRIDADERKTRVVGEAQAKLDAERVAYDATVGSGYEPGEVIDADFEVEPPEQVAAERERIVASLTKRLPYMAPEVRAEWPADLLAEAQARWDAQIAIDDERMGRPVFASDPRFEGMTDADHLEDLTEDL